MLTFPIFLIEYADSVEYSILWKTEKLVIPSSLMHAKRSRQASNYNAYACSDNSCMYVCTVSLCEIMCSDRSIASVSNFSFFIYVRTCMIALVIADHRFFCC